MKSYRKYLTIFGLSVLGLSSCEKVIDVPLEESERRFVVEAILLDEPGTSHIMISKTGSVYAESNFDKVSGANVSVTDLAGNLFTFVEDPGQPGKYVHPTFAVNENDEYNLNIVVEGQTFTSVSRSYKKPQLDSLNFIEQIGSFGFGTDTTYLVFFSFVDDADYTNYYRVNAYINGSKESAYYIVNDDLNNGQTYTQPLFASTVEKGDTVLVELLSMDEGTYKYFFSLPAANAEGPFAPTPANPVSNIEGNAIGYFAVYNRDTMTIIMPQ